MSNFPRGLLGITLTTLSIWLGLTFYLDLGLMGSVLKLLSLIIIIGSGARLGFLPLLLFLSLISSISSLWIFSLSDIAGITGTIAMFTVMFTGLTLIYFIRYGILYLGLGEPFPIAWLLVPLALTGLELLRSKLFLFKYPLLSEAFLTYNTPLDIFATLGEPFRIWLIFLLIYPPIYIIWLQPEHWELIPIEENLVGIILPSTKFLKRYALTVWLTFCIVTFLLGIYLKFTLSEGAVKLDNVKLIGIADAPLAISLREFSTWLGGKLSPELMLSKSDKVSFMVFPENTVHDTISNSLLERSNLRNSLKLNVKLNRGEVLVFIGGVFRTESGLITGTLIAKLSSDRELEIIGLYVKRELVPAGEWIPEGLIAILKRLNFRAVELIGNYQPGKGNLLLQISLPNKSKVYVQILNCSEALFPDLVSQKADIIVFPSNLSWFRGKVIHDMLKSALRSRMVHVMGTVRIKGGCETWIF